MTSKAKESKRPRQGSPDPSSRKKRNPMEDTDDLEILMGEIVRENPPVDTALVKKIIGAPVIRLDQDWTQADENKVLARWNGSERKAASDAIGHKAAKYFEPPRELWKICLRIFKQASPIMLSPFNGLQFVPQRVSASSHSRHLFNPDTCRSMAALIVHPIWQQDYRRFIGALSYAFICRLDECRKFAPRDDECPVLRILNQRIDLEEGPMLREPLHKMHSEARKAVRRQRNGDKPSALSNLLYALGKSITTMDPTKNEAESLEQDILPFNLPDLRSLKDAIDKQAQHKVDESYTTFKKLVNLSVELPSKNDLRQWDARAVTYLFRRYENEARFGSVTPGPDVEDDDIEEDVTSDDVTSDEVEEESERPAGIPIFGFEATDSNPTARSDVAVESPQHLNDDHIEPELSDEEGFNPQADDIGPSIEVPSGNAGASHRLRSPPPSPPPPPPPPPPQWAYHSFTPRPSNNRRPTLGDVEALRIAIDSRNNAQMREDIDNLMAQPSMGEAEIRQLIRDENSSLQSLIQDHAEENRGLQARLEAHEEDSQRLQTQLDQEKRKRQKGRETQWQRYRLLEAEVRSLKEEGRRYGLLEAEVQSLKERLDAQSTMSLPVVPQQTEDPQQAEEHVSETHDATSPEPRDQDRATFLASAPEGGSMAFHASCGT